MEDDDIDRLRKKRDELDRRFNEKRKELEDKINHIRSDNVYELKNI